MRTLFILATLSSLAACGSGQQAAAPGNDTARINNQIAAQANEIRSQADNGAAAIEQALENEGAALFESRNSLLNEAAGSTAPAAASANRQR